MLDWDGQLLTLIRNNQLTSYLHYRYVDDGLEGMKALKPGVRWSEEEGRIILHPHLVEEDLATSPDLRTMREVVKMGNTIDPMVQLTGDCPSNNNSGKMPVLDLQIWTEGEQVLYEHYRKPMANKLLMLEMSALPAAMCKGRGG